VELCKRLFVVLSGAMLSGALAAQEPHLPSLEEQCQALIGEHIGLAAALEVLDARLERRLAEAAAAPAAEKPEKLAAALRELIAQRRGLHEDLLRLQLRAALYLARSKVGPGLPGSDCPLFAELLAEPWPPAAAATPAVAARPGAEPTAAPPPVPAVESGVPTDSDNDPESQPPD
jgi:hypothetical protein